MRRRVWTLLLTRPGGLASIAILLLVVIGCVGAPLFAPYGPVTNRLSERYQVPSWAHLLGTDALGRDTLSRLLFGGQSALGGAALAVATAAAIGIPLGIVAGYFGGRLDAIIGRGVDVAMSIPSIIVILMVLAVFGGGQAPAMIMLGVLFAPGLTRVVRASALTTRSELFVKAARVSGLGHVRIMVRHVWPSVTGPVIVRMSLLAANALLVQTALSFLGLGVTPPYPSWGLMVAEASKQFHNHPWMIWPAGGVITLVAMAFVMLGDAVRDSLQAAKSPLAPATRARAVEPRRYPAGAVPGLEGDTPPVCGQDPLLSVSNLTVEMPLAGGPTRIVEAISFSVQKGETVALVGESGCGKSVTALSLIGMTPGNGRIVSGSVMFEGRDLVTCSTKDLEAVRGKRIGYISQEPMVALDPLFTVGSQLIEAIRRHTGMRRKPAEARMIALLQLVQIRDPHAVARRYPHEISGGMAQRVVIARALAGDPVLLIADEPTTALDATVQADLLDLLRSIQQKLGMAMVLVTHDWGVVADIADRVVVMYAGQAVEHAVTGPLFERPLHPYSVALLKADPHLVVEGERLYAIDGSVPPPGSWPVGCHFANRCGMAEQACATGPVSLRGLGPDRASRCIRAEALLERSDP